MCRACGTPSYEPQPDSAELPNSHLHTREELERAEEIAQQAIAHDFDNYDGDEAQEWIIDNRLIPDFEKVAKAYLDLRSRAREIAEINRTSQPKDTMTLPPGEKFSIDGVLEHDCVILAEMHKMSEDPQVRNLARITYELLLQRAMAENRTEALQEQVDRLESALLEKATQQASCDISDLRDEIAEQIAKAEMLTPHLLDPADYEKFPIYRQAFELAADRIVALIEQRMKRAA